MSGTLSGLNDIFKNLDRLVENVTNNVADEMDRFGALMENAAKRDAPWTDRTGDARRSIEAATLKDVDKIATFLSIGVEYGKYLELSNAGKYAIVWVTITANRQEFIKALKRGFTL